MKKLLTYALITAFVLAPQAAFARSLDQLKIQIVPNEKKLAPICDYKINDKYELNGCLWQHPYNKIYLRGDRDPVEMLGTFMHELGHFYLQDATDLSLFKHRTRVYGKWMDPEEFAADQFKIWLISPELLPPAERAFFDNLVYETKKSK